MDRAFPSRVEWALTEACELQCRHCLARLRRSQRAELSPAEAGALAEELAAQGVRQVTLSGGEPLLRPDWSEIAGRLGAQGIEVQLISNGQTLDRCVARRARAAGVRRVLLSLDGLEPTHDAIRGRTGAYRAVVRAARALDAAGLSFGVLTTVLAANRRELEQLGWHVAAWGASVWQVWLGIPQDRSGLWLAPRALPGVVRRLVALHRGVPILRLGDNLGTGCDSGALRTWTTALGAVVAPPPAGQRGFSGCEAGRQVLGIRSDGTIAGCLALPPGRDLGTVRASTLGRLAAAVADERLHRLRRLAGRCLECAAAERCGGGCHATALAATGRIENPYCEAAAGRREPAPARRRLVAAATGLAACVALGLPGLGCRTSGSATEGRATTEGSRESGAAPTAEAVTRPRAASQDGRRPGTEDGSESPVAAEDVAAGAEAAAADRGPSANPDAAPDAGAGPSPDFLPACCFSHMLPGPDCNCGGPGLVLPPRDAPPSGGDAPDADP